MNMEQKKIPDEYISIIQVVSEDKNLKNWIIDLENSPENLRFSELKKITANMRNNDEDEVLIAFFEELIKKSFLNAVLQTIRRL